MGGGGGRGKERGVKYYALNVDLSKVGGLDSCRIRRWEKNLNRYKSA